MFFGNGTHSTHPDDKPFDGKGGVLAHAFYPVKDIAANNITGDVHFDDTEYYVANTNATSPGNDFFTVLQQALIC